MDVAATNQKTYDSLAAEYEDKARKRRDYNKKLVERFCRHITSGKQVLDLGCAVGLDVSHFIAKGFETTGLDISENMLKFAKQRNPKGHFIAGDFMTVPLGQKFDGVFAQSFIHLYPKNEAVNVLRKIHKTLNPLGVCYLTTSKSGISAEGWLEKTDYSGSHKRYRKLWTKDELTEAVEKVGFEIIEYYESTDPFNKEWMIITVRKPA